MSFVRKFYIADSHFNHDRILSMQPRPFETIVAHDEVVTVPVKVINVQAGHRAA